MEQSERERKSSQLSHDRWSLVKKSTNLSNKLFSSLVTEIQTSFFCCCAFCASVCNVCMLLVYMLLMTDDILNYWHRNMLFFLSVLRRRLCFHSSNKHFKISLAKFQKVWAVFHLDHFAMLNTLYSIFNMKWINPRCFWFQNWMLIYVGCIIFDVIHAIEMSTKPFWYWTIFFFFRKKRREIFIRRLCASLLWYINLIESYGRNGRHNGEQITYTQHRCEGQKKSERET